jgi:hypothetical protein
MFVQLLLLKMALNPTGMSTKIAAKSSTLIVDARRIFGKFMGYLIAKIVFLMLQRA